MHPTSKQHLSLTPLLRLPLPPIFTQGGRLGKCCVVSSSMCFELNTTHISPFLLIIAQFLLYFVYKGLKNMCD